MNKIKMIGLLDIKGQENVRRVYDPSGIGPCLTTSAGGNRQPKIIVGEGNGLKILKTNDLFCGAGGMGLGFKQAGFEIAGAWDFDKFAVRSYKHNVGDHVQQSDITEMSWEDMPHAESWTFGFPCQDLSIAGKQAGLFEGKRSGLFFEVMRLLDETAYEMLFAELEGDKPRRELPKIIMAENVKGLKPYLGVLEEEYKKRGYKMVYTLYNTKFWGLPQNRERFFVIGVHESIEKEFEFPVQQDKYVPILSTILENEVDEKYYISDEIATKIIEKERGKNEDALEGNADKTLQSLRKNNGAEEIQQREINGVNAFQQASLLRQGMYEEGFQRETEEKDLQVGEVASNSQGVEDSGSLRDLQQRKKCGYTPQGRKLAEQQTGEFASVVSELPYKSAQQEENLHYMWETTEGAGILRETLPEVQEVRDTSRDGVEKQNLRVRKLTETEYKRLQGFPESYEIVVSPSQAYKQFGNAVSVPVARAIAERIKMFLLSI